MDQEKRQYPRHPFVERITVITPEEKSYFLESKNLSLTGIFLVTQNPLPLGKEGILTMTFNAGGIKKYITVKFRVIHNEPLLEGSSGMGVEFIEMAEEYKSLLKQIIEQIQGV